MSTLKNPMVLADENMRRIWLEIRDTDQLSRWASGCVRLIPTEGVSVHPSTVREGDTIDDNPVGWNKTKIKEIAFRPSDGHMDGVLQKGHFTFTTEDGFRSCYVCGTDCPRPLYRFP